MIHSLVFWLGLGALPLAAPSARAQGSPTILLLAIADRALVSPKQVARMEALLRRHNPGARVLTVREGGTNWGAWFAQWAQVPRERFDMDDLQNDFETTEDDMSARVRRTLIETLSTLRGPIDQLVVLGPVLGFHPEDGDTPGKFHVLGLGGLTSRGFDSRFTLALSPLRHRLSKRASIVMVGGHVLSGIAEVDTVLARRVLDFFGASEGCFFGLKDSSEELQPAKLRPALRPLTKLKLAGATGAVATLAWASNLIAWPWGIFWTAWAPFQVDAARALVDFARVMPRRHRQMRFGLHFVGQRIDFRGGSVPLRLDRQEREIFDCSASLERVTEL